MNHPAILQLEDDDNDVVLLQFAFDAAKIPHRIITVRDGQEAINYLAGHGQYADRARFPLPLLAILDLKTPQKSGQEVLQWIRAHPKLGNLVTIILSASANQSDIDAAYAARANAFLVKPAGLDKLTELVRALYNFWVVQNVFPENPVINDQGNP